MYMQTKTSVANMALIEAKKTLQSFIDTGPSEEELEGAKRGMIGAFALSIGNNARIADTISEMIFYNIPLDYLNLYPEIIRKLTTEKVHDTFKKYIKSDKMALVVVGENAR